MRFFVFYLTSIGQMVEHYRKIGHCPFLATSYS